MQRYPRAVGPSIEVLQPHHLVLFIPLGTPDWVMEAQVYSGELMGWCTKPLMVAMRNDCEGSLRAERFFD